MSICWYCHWGWAKPVAEIYRRAVEKLDGDNDPLHFGPAHVVWEDENFDLAEACIETFDRWSDHLNEHEREVVMQSLVELAALSLEVREIVPADYDGRNPQNYPPPEGVEVVKTSYWNPLREGDQK